jgi:hypothetical protein
MKKTMYLLVMMLAVISFSSCGPAYVSIEPAYVEYERPMRPSINHIWIEGNWIWSNQTRNGRTYQQGHWKQGPRGKTWQKGRWN